MGAEDIPAYEHGRKGAWSKERLRILSDSDGVLYLSCHGGREFSGVDEGMLVVNSFKWEFSRTVKSEYVEVYYL